MARKELESQLRHQLQNQLQNQLWYQLGDGNLTPAQLGNLLHLYFVDQLGSGQLWDQLYSQLWTQLCDYIWTQSICPR